MSRSDSWEFGSTALGSKALGIKKRACHKVNASFNCIDRRKCIDRGKCIDRRKL